jgi:hypothetical protein
MPRTKVYISGPMSGERNLNFPAFDIAKQRLTILGFQVVSPADLERERCFFSYQDKLRDDIRYLLDCEAIYLLDGWEHSQGAKIEFAIAVALNMVVMYE